MTDTTHTADTDYHHDPDADRQEAPHMQGVASLRINPPKTYPHYPRGWPLTARAAVALLFVALATTTVMALLMLHKVSLSASNASNQAVSEQGTVTQLRHEIADIQVRISVPAPVFRMPANLQHYGMCVDWTTDNATGYIRSITMVPPVVTAGSYSCAQGTFVSTVPVRR